MRSRGYSLRQGLLVAVIVPLFGVFALVGWLVLHQLETWVEGRLQEEVQLVARTIRPPLGQAVERGDERTVQELLESAFRLNRVYGVYVFGADGVELAAVGTRRPTPAERRLSRFVEAGDQRGEYERIEGREVYSYFVPLSTSGGEVNGLLQVTRRRSDFDNYVADVRRAAAGVLLGGMLLIGGVALYGHRRAVGLHVDRLRDSMTVVGRGERDHRAAVRGPHELSTLAVSLNRMLDNLAAAERAVSESERARRVLETRLRHAENLAALGRLSAGVAHELGTPLSVIEGRAMRAQRAPHDARRVRATFAEIRREVQRLEHIVRQLLDFGRAHRMRLRPVSAERLAASAVAALDAARRDHATTVEVAAPERPVTIAVDVDRVEQALINLLRNALDAVPGGCVRLSWAHADEHVAFTVDDSGPGVPPDRRAHVFEPFFTTKDVGSGTGLGLAIVHTVAEEHGGHVEVDDGPLGGARFRMVLPLNGPEAPRERT